MEADTKTPDAADDKASEACRYVIAVDLESENNVTPCAIGLTFARLGPEALSYEVIHQLRVLVHDPNAPPPDPICIKNFWDKLPRSVYDALKDPTKMLSPGDAARQRADTRHHVTGLTAVRELYATRRFTALCLIAAQRIVDYRTKNGGFKKLEDLMNFLGLNDVALSLDRDETRHVFRLAGIYGPGQSQLVQLARGTAKRIIKPGQVFNRIHVDDIAEVLLAAIEKHRVTHVYMPPTLIYILLAHPDIGRHDYSSLRHLVYASAPMSVDKLVEAVRDASGGESRLFIQIIDFLSIRRRPAPSPRRARCCGILRRSMPMAD